MPLWLHIFMFTRNMYPLRHLNSHLPTPSQEWDFARIPLLGRPYLLTDRPQVTDGHGAGSYPEVTPLDGSPALRTLCIDRTCSHTTTVTPTSHKAVSSTRDSTSSNRARTRPQAVYGLVAASFLAQPRANTHASPSAAPRRLRVPRARA